MGVERWLRERCAANPYQRPGGPHFTDLFASGAACFFLPITPRWGIKAFHNEARDSPAERASGTYLLARDNWLIQAEIQKRGLAPRVGPLVRLSVLGTAYNGYWTEIAQPISAERFLSERKSRSTQLLELGLADLDHPKNAGLIDDRFVVVDFSIVQCGERYLGAEGRLALTGA
ncbi:MAG TPA: hypothetical protein VGP63_15110 [Planctomycetaceae bacterium]|jgi:hypothetical protein|nr:hypothetical protein [Planctomycetaceae bacterium]